ncbi:8-oxo-dGTP diphosphatase [Weissella minor]|uniref:Nudix hydrolase domain-containing protein n=1 Tax=Weissella minor TaxID=1620 RepID=A0A0R2JJ87_9LACO|nr:NUDIX domain-containing protein [Weissella minor]KRN77339.1 hypothetical protein IV67_GL001696 [Weissella minor]
MSKRTTPVELTNMILIEDLTTHAVLVEDRKNPTWPGVTFPGGHIEPGETVTESVIREAYEETGLTITNPQLMGIKEWPLEGNARYIVFLYKTQDYTGELKSSSEGDIFWTSRTDLLNGRYDLPNTFAEMLTVFDESTVNELALITPEDASQDWIIDWQ